MLINNLDNVEVRISDGHKYAVVDIKKGENVIKYGEPIGHAICDIKKGEHVHTHNMRTNLSDKIEYTYSPYESKTESKGSDLSFMGYARENGTYGIRNDIWIVSTVGCINKSVQRIADLTEAKCFTHPFGCSQLGADLRTTQLILRGIINNPNAGGVLVVGLGCENNNIPEFKKVLGEYNKDSVKFLNCQDVDDEIAEGVKLVSELQENAKKYKRQSINISNLKVGLKCGGSDGLSGITANPLVGKFCDFLTGVGGKCVLTEVPEMFGAEHLLMKRCKDEAVFNKTVQLINDFKEYFLAHNQTIYENPSPGNKAGGITTLEEKSLGCVQKGGSAKIVDVLDYGDSVNEEGLSLLTGPGNDIVAVTNLMACGVNLILFTTGRGTPVGTGVPTIKLSTNSDIFYKKRNWFDFDAGIAIEKDLVDDLVKYIIRVANGEKTKNELNGYEEISIFKDGVVL